MKREAIGGGAYQSNDGPGGAPRYWSRPWINRGTSAKSRTWRLLEKATTRKAAIKTASGADWDSETGSFAALAGLYEDAGCPNRRLEARSKSFSDPESKRIAHLKKYFGQIPAADIRLVHIPQYAIWRKRRGGRGTMERTIDLETQTLSNVLNYGVAIGHLEINYVRSGRPRYRRAADVAHCRDKAPSSADQVHKIADYLFDSVRSESIAWQLLFTPFTALRTNELLKLRADAQTPDQPGFIKGDRLFVRRSKGGINPWVIIGPEFRDMIECFQRWHRIRFPKSHWYFPGKIVNQPLDKGSLGHALKKICKDLEIPHMTPHGLRSFYVTKRRSDGASEVQIAGEIGDRTVALLQTTYGNRPESWTGGKALTWLPDEGLPAWHRWKSPASKIAAFPKP